MQYYVVPQLLYDERSLVPICRTPIVNLQRGMAGAEGTPKYGAAKSFKEAWLSDKGVSQNQSNRLKCVYFLLLETEGRWHAAAGKGRWAVGVGGACGKVLHRSFVITRVRTESSFDGVTEIFKLQSPKSFGIHKSRFSATSNDGPSWQPNPANSLCT